MRARKETRAGAQYKAIKKPQSGKTGRKTAQKTEKIAKIKKFFKKLSKILHKRLTFPCAFGKIDTLRKYAVYWADAGSYCKSEEKATSADNFRRQCEGETLATDRGFA